MPFFRSRHDVNAELKSHLELEEAELCAAGMSPEEARRVARLKFGNVAAAAERTREQHAWYRLETLWQDVRYGARLLRKSPGFAVSVTLVLSLGIGVNAALFSIVRSVFVPSLGVPAPEQLGYFAKRNGPQPFSGAISSQERDLIEESGQQLADFASHDRPRQAILANGDRLHHVNLQFVDGRYFSVVEIPIAHGRRLLPADGDPTNEMPAAVMGHRLWVGAMNADPHVIGQTVVVDERPVAIVGVADAAFTGLADPATRVDLWVVPPDVKNRSLQPVFRVHDGHQFGEMSTMLANRAPVWQERFWERLSPEARNRTPDFLARRPFAIFRADSVSDPQQPDAMPISAAVLVSMFTVVVLVWLIATTNVSGLLMARGVSRTGELAVRRALGAGRVRIVQQILTESVIVATAAGAVGLALAVTLVNLFTAHARAPLFVNVRLDWHIALVASALAVVAGLAVGIAPALRAVRLPVLTVLTNGPHTGTPAGRRISRWLLVPQVAASVALLIVAAVHARSLARAEYSPGFESAGVQSVPATLWNPRDAVWARLSLDTREASAIRAQRAALYRQRLLEQAKRLPGVAAFGLVTSLPLPPFGLRDFQYEIGLREDYEAGLPSRISAPGVGVSSGYFDAMRIRILRGRTFRETGSTDGRPEVIVSASLARALGQGKDVLGRSLAPLDPNRSSEPVWQQIVGIVSDVETMGSVEVSPFATRVSKPVDAITYHSFHGNWAMGACCLVVRGADDRLIDAQTLRTMALAADPTADVTSVRPLADLVADAHYPRRLAALVLLSTGAVGLLLAIIGLYAAVSYAARQRVREIGVRAALGATRPQLTTLLLGDGGRVVALGAAIGLPVGISALRLTAARYPDLPGVDVLSFVLVPLVLAAVICVACVIPARRAARTDPAAVLRGE